MQILEDSITKGEKTVQTNPKQNQDKNLNDNAKTLQVPLYSQRTSASSEKRKIFPRVHVQYSKATILVKRRQNTAMTLNDIRMI